MKLIDFLRANHVRLIVKNYKVHLATLIQDSPFQAYYDGWFQEWPRPRQTLCGDIMQRAYKSIRGGFPSTNSEHP